MKIDDFVGKYVIFKERNERCKIYEITVPIIEFALLGEDEEILKVYRYSTLEGDPFSNGDMVFEDETLLEPFKAAFEEYCQSAEGHKTEYDYWSRII